MVNEQEARKRLEAVKIEHGTITNIEFVPEGVPEDASPEIPLAPLPAHCRVSVRLNPEGESDIRVEVWLPLNEWNGRYLGTGNGGYAARIDRFALMNGIRRGYATANTDMGTAPHPDALIGRPERWADFGYRATHLMTVAAKQIIRTFYGQEPRYSYFTGGSTGGQQGLMEAQRFPDDYDGILAIAPAHNRTHLHIAFIWNWLALTRDPDARFNRQQAQAVTERLLAVYGGEGRRIPGDYFFLQPDQIEVDVEIFRDLDALNPAQIRALEMIYQGPVNPATGERIYPPLIMPGSEAFSLGLVEQSDRDHFAKEYFYLFRWVFGEDYDCSNFDFDRDVEVVNERLAPLLNANRTDLGAFKDRGGKLLMLHGMADPIIPYSDSVQYYERVVEAQHGLEETRTFFRLFLIPGFAHVMGGPGVQDIGLGLPATPKDREHDALTALAAWVEEGIAPERLLPTAFRDGDLRNGLLPDGFAYDRPVYAYPHMALYESGDPNQPDNYRKAEHRTDHMPRSAARYLI